MLPTCDNLSKRGVACGSIVCPLCKEMGWIESAKVHICEVLARSDCLVKAGKTEEVKTGGGGDDSMLVHMDI
ncbi:hypothetical protein OROGR_034140 [Orobanche gracilis]